MNWRLSDRIDLTSPNIPKSDAERQHRTAAEMLRRFDRQPGLVLADEVGMGKTFVALAVAASVIEATGGKQHVVVMVPPSVGAKWPLEWKKFASSLKQDGVEIRATDHSVSSGSEFLKLLDDPGSERRHLIFLTHGALSNGLNDPLLKLAIVRRALGAPRLKRQRERFPRWAERVIPALKRYGLEPAGIKALMETPPSRWRSKLTRLTGKDPGDDPIPRSLLEVLPKLDVTGLREVLRADLPLHSSRTIESRLERVRRGLATEVGAAWRAALLTLQLELPLLILDEAHHTKNRGTRLAGLFANQEAREEVGRLRGELGGTFHRMLFLTATPFQLGHDELIEVLRRFTGVRWDDLNRDAYEVQLNALKSGLDACQAAAYRLDRAWGKLTPEDIASAMSTGEWWQRPDDETLPEAARAVASIWGEARAKAKSAEGLLRPHVIRHLRADRATRRSMMCGRAILSSEPADQRGLEVGGPAVLPFLLAARAQAIVAMEGLREHRRARALFADGLASSFEAYTRTRSPETFDQQIDDLETGDGDQLPPSVTWYLDRISQALPQEDDNSLTQHPKVAATVNRAVELWRGREKVLVFCFYIATGRALRRHIAKAIEREIVAMAAAKFELSTDQPDLVVAELQRFRDRLYDAKSPSRAYAEDELRSCLSRSLTGDDLELGVDLCLRFLRTYSFLVRYLDLTVPPLEALRQAFERPDASGRTFREVVTDFGRFIASREETEREHFLAALEHIDIGDIAVSDDEGEQEKLIANVRLANGRVKRDARERLMVAFNTPFYPEVLVASSVMAEGVDLHLTCRHVIHHDLDWNPSVIEQRTGRLDRIGSKGELTGLPVVVYEPFIEGTQDEKQFRVMHDRERWFNVVMGERLELDEWTTDQLAARVEFPEAAAAGVAMDLGLTATTET